MSLMTFAAFYVLQTPAVPTAFLLTINAGLELAEAAHQLVLTR